MSECLFSKDELKLQKVFAREFDFTPKSSLTAKELFVILDKKRDELNAKGVMCRKKAKILTYQKNVLKILKKINIKEKR